MNHPQADKRFLLRCIRGHILKQKRTHGYPRAARALVHYKKLIATYLQAKRELVQ